MRRWIGCLGAVVALLLAFPVPAAAQTAPTYDDQALGDSPTGFWPLSDASGTVATATVGTDGSYAGSITYGTDTSGTPVAGPGVTTTFGSTVTLPVSFPSTAQTLSFWANNAETIGSGSHGSFVGNSAGQVIWLGNFGSIWSGEVVSLFTANGVTWWSNLTVPAGWRHWAFVFDGTDNGWTLYIDGAPVTATKNAHDGGAGPIAVSSLQLGKNGAEPGRSVGFAGLATFDRQLTSTEVGEHFSPPEDTSTTTTTTTTTTTAPGSSTTTTTTVPQSSDPCGWEHGGHQEAEPTACDSDETPLAVGVALLVFLTSATFVSSWARR